MPEMTKQIGDFVVIHVTTQADSRVHVVKGSQPGRIVLKLAGASADCFHGVSEGTIEALSALLEEHDILPETLAPLAKTVSGFLYGSVDFGEKIEWFGPAPANSKFRSKEVDLCLT